MPKSKDPKTHFEQVPLEIVKKIAEEEIPDDETNGTGVTVEPPAKKCSAFSRFRRATVNVLQHPFARREGGLKVDEHRERLMELYKQASNQQRPCKAHETQ